MKKLITVILILCLLLPAAALADDRPVGCWATYSLLTTGAPQVTTIYLAEDHTCYFLIRLFDPDGEGNGRTFVGTWEQLPDGHFLAKTGNNTSTELIIGDDNTIAYNPATNEYYVNLNLIYIYQ